MKLEDVQIGQRVVIARLFDFEELPGCVSDMRKLLGRSGTVKAITKWVVVEVDGDMHNGKQQCWDWPAKSLDLVAPSVPHIRLPVAPVNPAYCSGCKFDMSGAGHCQIWGKRGERGPAIPGSKGGSEYLRLPECLAAQEGGS